LYFYLYLWKKTHDTEWLSRSPPLPTKDFVQKGKPQYRGWGGGVVEGGEFFFNKYVPLLKRPVSKIGVSMMVINSQHDDYGYYCYCGYYGYFGHYSYYRYYDFNGYLH
jgi:hypothetical protein